ncbi:MAG: type IV toxin-antitoxin system AbiEi family antitoxin domain-containing protein [Pseudomonadales bacterium]
MAADKRRQAELDQLVPAGLIVTRKWLMKQGLTRHALDNQVKSHQFVPVLPGVYARPHVTLVWQNLVCSLTSVLDTGLHLGGLSALSLQGFGHYLELSDPPLVHLYGKKAPPAWTKDLLIMVEPVWYSTKRLWEEGAGSVVSKYTVDFKWRDDLPPMKVSSPERAYLELLMDVPGDISFEHADELMQGLTQLSPRKLIELLSVCKSVKVKRLFFWMADRHHYAWRKKLNVDDYNLGEGKRVIAKAGKLDSRYQITVPGAMHG